ncbi:MAG: helix-turn-helix domain-containing protein [Desulfobacteraceae bacterium]
MAKRISEEVRQGVAKAHDAGHSKKSIADRFGISVSSVTRIVREGGSKGAKSAKAPPTQSQSPEVQKKIAEVERRIAALERKIQYYGARKKGVGTRA